MPVLDATDHYTEAFEALERARRADPGWLRTLRHEAFDRFRALGFPTTRQEDWRFTNIAPVATTAFRQPSLNAPLLDARDLEPFRFAGDGWTELVFVNGRYRPELSRRWSAGEAPGAQLDGRMPGADNRPRAESREPKAVSGPRVASIAETLAADGKVIEAHLSRHSTLGERPFAALNTAFVGDGAVVHVPAWEELQGAIHLLFYSVPGASPIVTHPRVLIVAEPNSHARVVETYAGGDAAYLTNAVTEIVVGRGASVDHYKLQREATSAFHLAATDVHLGGDSRFTSYTVMIGGRIARNELTAVLEGEGASCTLNGVYLSDGDRLVDNHTAIDHATPNCSSHEVYKGILDGRARGVFNGKILVRPDAQKTDAKQTNKALLLSDTAQVDTKPQLEIFADDVKCTHGAAVGQLNDEALFYLRSRGIGRDEARSLLIYAFASDVVSHIELGPVRQQIDRVLREELGGRR